MLTTMLLSPPCSTVKLDREIDWSPNCGGDEEEKPRLLRLHMETVVIPGTASADPVRHGNDDSLIPFGDVIQVAVDTSRVEPTTVGQIVTLRQQFSVRIE